MKQTYPQQERRAHFRISIQARVNAALIHADSHQALADYFPASPNFALQSELRALDDEGETLLRRISERDKHLVAYLRLLNRKIQRLGQALTAPDSTEDALNEITLSEGGISFHCRDTYPAGSKLALQLQLMPGHLGLWLQAEVIYQQPTANQPATLRTGCRFSELAEADHLLLSRYILEAQARELRQQRQPSSKSSQSLINE